MKEADRRKRLCVAAWLMALLLVLQPLLPVPVKAEETGGAPIKVVTLGDNLNEDQKRTIMRFFGANEAEVTLITVNIQEEIDLLSSWIPLEQIGNSTNSCAYICLTDEGGIQVKTANLTYVDSNMISSTLSTCGVVNCDVVAACPFPVSGTGALTGCIKAYETAISGALDPAKKDLATEEMVLTGDLSDEVGKEEATLVVNDIKITIIRDDVNGDENIARAVDEVISNTEAAVAASAIEQGMAAPASMSQENRERLYSFAGKVSAMNYVYDEVKFTLQRVTKNITEAAGIDDPILETFEEDPYVLGEDSILRNTDDAALGGESYISATNQSAVGDGSASADYEAAAAGDSVSLSLYGETWDERFADGTNLMIHQGEDGTYSLVHVDGSPASESGYDYSFYNDYGYLEVQKDNGELNSSGLLDQNGAVVIPAVYGDVDVLGEHWAVAVRLVEASADDYDYKSWNGESFYMIDTADFYYLDGQAGLSPVGFLSRSDYESAAAEGSYLNIQKRSDGTVTTYDSSFTPVGEASSLYSFRDLQTGDYIIYRENGRYGVKDKDENVLIPPAFSSISDFHNGLAEVYNGTGYGIADREGKILVQPEYDDVQLNYYGPDALYGADKYAFDANGYFAVKKGDNYGFVSWNGGTETCAPSYHRDVYDLCGAVLLAKGPDNRIHLVAADGTETVLPETYAAVSVLDYSSGLLLRATNENSNFELLDWHGNQVLAGEFQALRLSGDGKYLLAERSFSAPSAIYEVSYVTPEKNGMEIETEETLLVAEGGSATTGVTVEELYEVEADDLISRTNLLKVSDGKMYGIADLEGNPLSELKYRHSLYENQGYITAEYDNGELNSKGLLAQTGEEILPFQYGEVKVMSEDWVIGYVLEVVDAEEGDFTVYTGGGSQEANIVRADVYYRPEAGKAALGSFTRDEFEDAIESGDYLNIKNRTSQEITTYDSSLQPVQTASDMYSFKDLNTQKYISFRDNGHTGIMDLEGNVILPAAYRYVDSYVDGYAVVNDGEKKGLVNPEGELVLPVMFDRIARLYDPAPGHAYDYFGYYMTEVDGEAVFVKTGGEITCRTGVDYYSLYAANGATAVTKDENGVYTIYAADGVITQLDSSIKYLYCVSYTTGMIYKAEGENYKDVYLLDWHGNQILPADYYSADATVDGKYLLAEDADWNHHLFAINYGMEDEGTESAPAAEETESAAVTEPEAVPESAAPAEETTPAAQTEPSAPAEETTPAPTAPAQTPPAAEGWTCSNGHTGNTGKFCTTCGEAKPAEGWTCSNGHTGNTGNFCTTCGEAKPAESWTCSNGHTGNTGKFCTTCGEAKPEGGSTGSAGKTPAELLQEVLTVLDNPEADLAGVKALLEEASASLAADSEAASVIGSAVSLIDGDMADAATLKTLTETAMEMLP